MSQLARYCSITDQISNEPTTDQYWSYRLFRSGQSLFDMQLSNGNGSLNTGIENCISSVLVNNGYWEQQLLSNGQHRRDNDTSAIHSSVYNILFQGLLCLALESCRETINNYRPDNIEPQLAHETINYILALHMLGPTQLRRVDMLHSPFANGHPMS